MRTYWYRNIGADWHFAHDERDDFPEEYHRVADFAVWDVKLTEAEITQLKNGARPNKVRPKNLIKWAPMDVPTKSILGL